jgi:hypothetical protein
MGERPLLIGRKAPPHPAIVPHMMGPKRGKEKVDGAIAADAATVKVKTTLARTASYMIMKQD